ncbi:unnamed protein product [Paramecium sonneborni]|uniref:UvrD-like helicase ATP-binding domain-containing protein n=1 Tax=Paramecium sonneborni TaxID=65129 RepID=A0A8S1K1M6_9CILI|nr:unnamed protein product [Paramecium sonneborni]
MKRVQNNNQSQVFTIKSIVKKNQRIIQAELNQILESNRQVLQNISANQFLLLWFEQNAEERSKYILSGQEEMFNFQQKESKSNLKNEIQVLKAAKFLDEANWHYKITNKFSQTLYSKQQHSLRVLAYLKTILQGYFSMIDQGIITTVIDIEPLSIMQAYFQTKTDEGFTFFWEVAIDQIPKLICQNKLNINQIVGFNFIHTITFIDIKFEANFDKDTKFIIQNYHIETKNSIFRRGIDNQILQEIQEENLNNINKEYLFIKSKNNNNQYWELAYNLRKNQIIKWLSHKILPKFLTKQEQDFFEFDLSSQQWINKSLNYKSGLEENLEQQQQLKNDIIQKLADFSSSSKLVEFLQKIPNFTIKLTDEQKQIIGKEGKVIFTGRSGTGKTTCLILRLLAMQYLFKLRLQIQLGKNPQLKANDLFISCVFVSSSHIQSVLAKNYYKKLNYQIQSQLDKKQSKFNNQFCSQTQDFKIDSNNYNQKHFDSFYDVIQEDYPLFLTIKQLIFMIDASLNQPFFSQNQTKEQYFDHNFSIYNSYYDISFQHFQKYQQNNLFLHHEIDLENQINFEDLIKQKLQEQIKQVDNQQKMNMNMQKEVDFRFFLNNFWLKKCSNIHLNPYFVWTQIYSHIKGSCNSHEYPGHSIPQITFLHHHSNKKEFKMVYEIFIQYEKWRICEGYFDLLDIVNHILVQIKQEDLSKNLIHYLFLDEIQDLPEALILLFEKISILGTLYSGDTAQNICKGVGFRFLTIQDYKKIIESKDDYNYYQSKETLQILNQNFRSNFRILNLANSIVSLIEIYFPKTIDFLKKQSSNFEGFKPIIVNGSLDLLFYLFEGIINLVNSQEIQKLPLELGQHSVIIVKNQESKKNVPKLFQHILVLSIEEIKGLEFENVILYNFFNDDYIGELEWKLLQTCEIIDEEINRQTFMKSQTRESTIDYYTSYFTGFDDKNGNVIIKRMISYIKYQDELSYNNSGLCNELKQLYIAITRARKFLYIFDEKPQTRKWIETIWKNLDLVQILNYPDFNHQNFQEHFQIKSKDLWKEQGIFMYQEKFYEQAEKCFQFSEYQNLQNKTKALQLSIEACQSLLSYQQSQKYPKLKQQIAEFKQQYMNQFFKAAELFYHSENLKQAALCYSFSEQYEKALEIYDRLELFYQAGEAAYQCQKYIEAAKYFLKCKDFLKTIDSYEKANEFEKILEVLYKQKDQINNVIRTQFFNQYFPILLKKLTIEVENQFTNDNQIDNLEYLIKYFINSQKIIEEIMDFTHHKYESQTLQNQQIINVNKLELKSQQDEQNSKPDFYKKSFLQQEQRYFPSTIKDKNQVQPKIQQINFSSKSKIQDLVIKKLLQYIIMFQDEFSKSLLKNYDNKLEQQSVTDYLNQQVDQSAELQIDPVLVDKKLILWLLDILDQFQNFILCILICDMYSLQNQMIKYLIKIAVNLSPLLQQQCPQNILNLNNLEQMQILKKRGQVASFTLQQIFQIIDFNFLNLKFDSADLIPEKSLDNEIYAQLILLGYWKKVIYLIDIQNSLSICKLFMDYKSWKCIYWMNSIYSLEKIIQSNNNIDVKYKNSILGKQQSAKQNLNLSFENRFELFEKLNFDHPLTGLEIQYILILLEQYYDQQIIQLILDYKIPQWLYFKQHSQTLNNMEKNEINKQWKAPPIFHLSQNIFDSIFAEAKLKQEIINEIILKLEIQNLILDELSLFQSVYLILFYCQQIVHNKSFQIINRIEDIDGKLYCKLIESLIFIIRVINTNQDQLQKQRQIVIRSVLSYFKIRQPDNIMLLQPFFNSLLIHTSSIILEEIVQQTLQNIENKEFQNNIFFADIDLNFVIAPKELVIKTITKKIFQEILDLNIVRKKFMDNYNLKYSNSFQNYFDSLNVCYYFQIHNKYWQNIYLKDNQSRCQEHKQLFQELQNYQRLLFLKSKNKEFNKGNGFLKLLLKNSQIQCNSKQQKFFINYEGLNKLSKQYNNQKDLHGSIIKSIILLNYSNSNHLTYIYLTNKIQQGFGNQFGKYFDFFQLTLYKKWNMIDSATDFFIKYLQLTQDITQEELIYNLISLFIYNIIGIKLNIIDKCSIYIPRSYSIYFNQIIQTNENKLYQETNFYPVKSWDNLLYIFKKLISFSKINPALNQLKIKQLIFILSINLDEISIEMKQLITDQLLQTKETKNEKGLNDQFINAINNPFNIEKLQLFKIINEDILNIEIRNTLKFNSLSESKWVQLKNYSENCKLGSKLILRTYKIYRQKRTYFCAIKRFLYEEYHFSSYFKVSLFINVINVCIKIRSKLLFIFYQQKIQKPDLIFKFIYQFKQLQEIEKQLDIQQDYFKSKKLSKYELIGLYNNYMEKCQQIIRDNLMISQSSFYLDLDNLDQIIHKFKIEDMISEKQEQKTDNDLQQ